MITTCTIQGPDCCHAYEAGSEEQANESVRACFNCRQLDATREAILADAPSEVACLFHRGATILHLAAEGCPLCKLLKTTPNPEAIVAAIHALATAPAPFNEALQAVKAMEPITRQLKGTNGITTLGHTVGDLQALGAAQAALEGWLNNRPEASVAAARIALMRLTDAEREALLGDFCDGCGKVQPWAIGEEGMGCQCQNDD